MLYKAPTPEEYKKKHYEDKEHWQRSGQYAYSTLVKYWKAKEVVKTPKEIEIEKQKKLVDIWKKC